MSKKEPVSLYDLNVCGPEALDIHDSASAREVDLWWQQAQMYAKSMVDVDRCVMLCRVEDEKKWYLASIPEAPDAR